MSIGERIRIYRKAKNFTQGQLAELIGVSTQAISKWETAAGMPDISQIVPLACVLEVSTDKLLGHTDEAFDKEAETIRRQSGGINFISDEEQAETLYKLASNFFNRHPDISDIALVSLECYIELYAKGKIDVAKDTFLAEAERYGNNIFRYETNQDRVCKTYYLMSRAYSLCDEKNKAEQMLRRLPYIFGDREYWEAETAYADKKYDVALKKIKKSFAMKARFISRCIRMAVWITKESDLENADEKCIELQEYMLRIIDVFLSGGEYIPRRQVFQKTAVLAGLVTKNMRVGNVENARAYLDELVRTRDEFFAFLDNPKGKKSLMFLEGEDEGEDKELREFISERVEEAKVALNAVEM